MRRILVLIGALLASVQAFDKVQELGILVDVSKSDFSLRGQLLANGGTLADENYNLGFAYGPAIIKEGDEYHMFVCSNGVIGDTANITGWDRVRHFKSLDGKAWGPPSIVVQIAPDKHISERSACDPSVVKKDGYWYLYYGGHLPGIAGVIYVARSRSIEGPYEKWTGSGWAVNPPQPKPIIYPKVPASNHLTVCDQYHINTAGDGNYYGAGQPSVVVRSSSNEIWMWYADASLQIDSTYPCSKRRYFLVKSKDGINFGLPIAIRHGGSDFFTYADGGEVKWNEVQQRFEMFQLKQEMHPDKPLEEVIQSTSTDGVNWTAWQTRLRIPNFSNNIGLMSDKYGSITGDSTILAFGTPWDVQNKHVFGVWDVYGLKIWGLNKPGPGYSYYARRILPFLQLD
ncbi:MAG: hypothetical protein IPK50_04230 [Fibrobacterota bacterium]|nr:MAG: hypothetical protein IPK50_04230 [Fibrobacterota bacterium]